MTDFIIPIPEAARPALMSIFDEALGDLMLHDVRFEGRPLKTAQISRAIFSAIMDGSLSPEEYKLLRDNQEPAS